MEALPSHRVRHLCWEAEGRRHRGRQLLHVDARRVGGQVLQNGPLVPQKGGCPQYRLHIVAAPHGKQVAAPPQEAAQRDYGGGSVAGRAG